MVGFYICTCKERITFCYVLLGYVLFQTLIAKLFSNLSNLSVGLVGKLTFMFSSQWFKVLKWLT